MKLIFRANQTLKILTFNVILWFKIRGFLNRSLEIWFVQTTRERIKPKNAPSFLNDSPVLDWMLKFCWLQAEFYHKKSWEKLSWLLNWAAAGSCHRPLSRLHTETESSEILSEIVFWTRGTVSESFHNWASELGQWPDPPKSHVTSSRVRYFALLDNQCPLAVFVGAKKRTLEEVMWSFGGSGISLSHWLSDLWKLAIASETVPRLMNATQVPRENQYK